MLREWPRAYEAGGGDLTLSVATLMDKQLSASLRYKVRMSSPMLASRNLETPRQITHYLECGPVDGPLMMFLHGWPSIGLLWRPHLEAFAADGWHCIAPDLRGYGRSFAPLANGAYTIEEVVADMVELQDHLGARPAIWVGHDWGSVVVSQIRVAGSQHR